MINFNSQISDYIQVKTHRDKLYMRYIFSSSKKYTTFREWLKEQDYGLTFKGMEKGTDDDGPFTKNIYVITDHKKLIFAKIKYNI